MPRKFKNISTGVTVETSNERVAAMYASHPSWKEVTSKARKGRQNATTNEEKPADGEPDSAENTVPEEE